MRIFLVLIAIAYQQPQPPSNQILQPPPYPDYWTHAIGPVTNPYPLNWQDPKNGWILASDPRAILFIPIITESNWSRQSSTVHGAAFFDSLDTPLPIDVDWITTWPDNVVAKALINARAIPPPLPGYIRGKPTRINIDLSKGAPTHACIFWMFIDTKTL